MEELIFWGLSWQAWLTIAVVMSMFLSLIFTKIRTEVAFLAAVSVLCISGVLDVHSAFGGFSSETVIVVGVLYIVIAGLTFTGVLNWIVKNLMGLPKTLSGAIVRLMLPVAVLSSLMSNTTVVALFINVVKLWSEKLRVAPSKLLIPLSYASGMGGICTLIGTPPNLIISGLYTDATGIKLSLLTPTVCGLFCLAVGILSTLAMQKLLPVRISPISNGNAQDFTAELTLPADYRFIGMTIEETMEIEPVTSSDLQLVAIRRFDNEIIAPVEPDEFLMGGDRLIFNGKARDIYEIAKRIGAQSVPLNGILEAEVSEDISPKKTLTSTLILITMVMLSSFNILPLLTSCLIAAIAMIVLHCCSSSQAMKSIDWNIITVFACSIAIGKAIEQTGIAESIANGLLTVCGSNPYVVLTATCFVATFITEFISNTAAGAMFFPIAMSSAAALGANPLCFCVALMISVSSSFATPIGSPTHMLVYAPGGYRFGDFMKIGLPMNIIILIANIFITTIVFPIK